MKVEIRFTLEIDPDELPAFRALAEVDDNTEAAYFYRAEAEEHVVSYMTDNGISSVRVVRRDGRTAPA